MAAALLGTACRTAAPPRFVSLPDPFAPPTAGDPLTPQQEKAARAAWAAAGRGDMNAVSKRLSKIPATHPVRQLIVVETRFALGEPVGAAALDVATRSPGYAAAWTLAALSADREGRKEDALAAARQALALRMDEPNRRVVAGLEAEVVAAGVSEASTLLARGDGAAALARARHVLEIVPGSDEARLVTVRAALAAGQTAQAAELLPALPDSTKAWEVKGRVAEALGQWDLALDFYGRLPEGFPGRCELMAGAREQSRLALAPPQVSRALAAAAVTRRQVAVILIWEAPFLTEKATGAVPVFEDVVGLPEGRDIVVAVRAGVMTGDVIARRFGPNRSISQRELLVCLERLAQVAAKPSPRWCAEGEAAAECVERPGTLDGKTVAGLARLVAGQEENPCFRQ